MTLQIEETKLHHIIRLKGDFDAAAATEARKRFDDLVKSPGKNILINFTDVEFIDSSGIGAIVFLFKRLRCNGFDLILTGLKAQPLELIQLLRIDKIIETHPYIHKMQQQNGDIN